MVERALLGVAKLRRALAIRYLFDNWYALLIRDAMAKLGFNAKFTARVDNYTIELSDEILDRLVNELSWGLIKPFRRIDGELYINNSKHPPETGCEINKFWDQIKQHRRTEIVRIIIKDGLE